MNGSPQTHGSAILNVPNAKASVGNKLRDAHRSPLIKLLFACADFHHYGTKLGIASAGNANRPSWPP